MDSQAVLGPNRFHYDVNQGEDFRIYVPHPYLGRPKHLILDQPQTTIEIYTTTQAGYFKLANQCDSWTVNQDWDQSKDPAQIQGVELDFTTVLVPAVDTKNIASSSFTIEEAVKRTDLKELFLVPPRQS